MREEIKCNFKTKFSQNLSCPLPNCDELDRQDHVLVHSDPQLIDSNGAQNLYNKIFSLDPEENLNAVRMLEKTLICQRTSC